MRGACLASDFALLELSTAAAAHGVVAQGPYSRFGWRQPGPAYFYVMAPLYRLSGGSTGSLPLSALILNWAAALAMALLLSRRAEHPAPLLLALGLSLAYAAYLGRAFAYNIWNPVVTVLPFGLLLLACAELACGESRALPVLALLGSFLLQTHVAYLPPVAVAVAIALVSWMRAERTRAWGMACLALGVVALLWALPLAEQVKHSPGNLTRIARFFLSAGRGHPVGEASLVVAREIAWPWT